MMLFKMNIVSDILTTVITIVNYDRTSIMIINYDRKTFIVQATGWKDLLVANTLTYNQHS